MNPERRSAVKYLSKQIGGKLREKVYTDDALRAMEALLADVRQAVEQNQKVEAIEFAEWIRTFDALDKKDGFWILESQLSSKDLYESFLMEKNVLRNDR